jgi:hypothetical protein
MPNQFRPTRWSVVLLSAQSRAPGYKEALAELCKIYWYPLYRHIRRYGFSAHDLTEGFFLDLLEHKAFARVDQKEGKFRSFLLASLQNFLSNEAHEARCLKRGGNDVALLSVLGVIDAFLDHKQEAIEEATRAMELRPISQDAVEAPYTLSNLTAVYAWTNEPDLAFPDAVSPAYQEPRPTAPSQTDQPSALCSPVARPHSAPSHRGTQRKPSGCPQTYHFRRRDAGVRFAVLPGKLHRP